METSSKPENSPVSCSKFIFSFLIYPSLCEGTFVEARSDQTWSEQRNMSTACVKKYDRFSSCLVLKDDLLIQFSSVNGIKLNNTECKKILQNKSLSPSWFRKLTLVICDN